MITEDYVSLEIAKLLKEKGFNELTPLSYSLPYGYESHIPCCNDLDTDFVSRITLQMAMKWLREVYKLFIELKMSIDLIGNPHYAYSVLGFDGKYKRENYTSFDWMFKDACEAAIKYCLEKLI